MASHRRPPQSGLTHSARATVLSAAAATAAAALGAVPASADPKDSPQSERAAVDRLFEEAERATEKFNDAGVRVTELRRKVARAQDGVARGQERVNRMRQALGAVAGAQYRSGGMDPALDLLFSSDPDTYLIRAEALERLGERHSGVLRDYQRVQRELGLERTVALRALAGLERSRAAVARHKRTVERKLATAQRLLNTLPARDREAYGRGSRSGRGEPPELSGAGPATSRAAAAVRAARSAVGRPYVWGANGPAGFDCSGLIQWSYAQAGVGLPRTSQAQRHAGRRIPLSEARPGDLVAYRSDASHIGMYMGGGQVVHAPYPGAAVRYDPVGMMPVSSVTRV
ncbi:C40 family peptidase [Streptomyces jumonjinensis]|uniref:NlpC/P60 family protein n=1 Tax=Streptomyces jumonjinensis TaxID=1945 RepID=A0A646KIX8_STRJU|nr:C40 family peptidase [Streptomyces jumonjinensis]MQT01006.1 NlpC/P60 family protein [Streptomyces jumonjinensis]